jgi:hypothetical protein
LHLFEPSNFERAHQLIHDDVLPSKSWQPVDIITLNQEVETEGDARSPPSQDRVLESPSSSAVEVSRHDMKTASVNFELASGLLVELVVAEEERLPRLDLGAPRVRRLDATGVGRIADVPNARTNGEV